MTPTTLLPDVLAVPCPETLAALNLYGNAQGINEVRALDWKIVNGNPKTKQWSCPLPPGSYEIIGPSKSISEEQAAQVVESTIGFDMIPPHKGDRIFKDYGKEHNWFYAALESLSSLLKSKGLVGNQLLIRKLK
jgi:hypothetical protein